MRVPSVRQRINREKNHKIKKAVGQNSTSFTATPSEILNSLEKARLCPGKKMFLKSVADFFHSLQAGLAQLSNPPSNFVYRLGAANDIPQGLVEFSVNGKTLAQMDSFLTEGGFKCSPTSTCACGAGISRGELAKRLLAMIGVENPDVIAVSKN